MRTFFEAESNGNKVMINILQIQLIEPICDSNQCILRFAAGTMEDIIVDEHYEVIKRRISEVLEG